MKQTPKTWVACVTAAYGVALKYDPLGDQLHVKINKRKLNLAML